METGIGVTNGTASMNVLKEDFEKLIPVCVEVLTNPAFADEKIELAKTQTKSSISRRNDDVQQIGTREFQRLIYGTDSRYGRNTEYETVNNISREDLVSFHDEHFTAENMMVGVVGDFDSDEMKEKLEETFGQLPAGDETTLEFPKVDYEPQSSINFINKPDVNQSFVMLGHIGGMRDNPDYAKVQVMNQVLSGGFSGRLLQEVRTEKGLAYSAFGQYEMSSFYPGTFYAGVMTKSSTTAEAIDAVITEIERLRNEPITQKELQDTKDQILNSSVFEYDSYEEVLSQQMSYDYRGLPSDAFEQYIEGVKGTTVDDVQRVAKEYLKPDQLEILAVGNEEEIGDQLKKYGDVNEIDISIPEPGSDQQAASGDAEKGEQLLNQMAEAILSGTEVNTLTLEGEIVRFGQQIPGGSMSMKTTQTIDYPDAVEQSIETPQGKINMSYKDGEGTMTMMEQERPLPPQQAQALKEALNRDYVAVSLNKDNLDPQFLGMGEFEGEQFAKVAININDKDITYFIDTETYLPRLMRYQQFNPQAGQQIQVEDRFSDWQSVDGIQYAFSQHSFADGEKNTEANYESVSVNE
jgi:predicted Zn-dependent peptidase